MSKPKLTHPVQAKLTHSISRISSELKSASKNVTDANFPRKKNRRLIAGVE